MAEIDELLKKLMATALATRDVVAVMLANQVATTHDPKLAPLSVTSIAR
jgi:hypothetical protein